MVRIGKGNGDALAEIRVRNRRLQDRCQIVSDASMSWKTHRPPKQPLSEAKRVYGFATSRIISDMAS